MKTKEQSDKEKPTASKAPASPDQTERHLYCPNCGSRLFNRSCKWWCQACGYHESCADG